MCRGFPTSKPYEHRYKHGLKRLLGVLLTSRAAQRRIPLDRVAGNRALARPLGVSATVGSHVHDYCKPSRPPIGDMSR